MLQTPPHQGPHPCARGNQSSGKRCSSRCEGERTPPCRCLVPLHGEVPKAAGRLATAPGLLEQSARAPIRTSADHQECSFRDCRPSAAVRNGPRREGAYHVGGSSVVSWRARRACLRLAWYRRCLYQDCRQGRNTAVISKFSATNSGEVDGVARRLWRVVRVRGASSALGSNWNRAANDRRPPSRPFTGACFPWNPTGVACVTLVSSSSRSDPGSEGSG